jgi:hypothetical protein
MRDTSHELGLSAYFAAVLGLRDGTTSEKEIGLPFENVLPMPRERLVECNTADASSASEGSARTSGGWLGWFSVSHDWFRHGPRTRRPIFCWPFVAVRFGLISERLR